MQLKKCELMRRKWFVDFLLGQCCTDSCINKTTKSRVMAFGAIFDLIYCKVEELSHGVCLWLLTREKKRVS